MGATSEPWKVIVTRRLPPAAMELLKAANPPLTLDIYDSDEIMPAAELSAKLADGADALLCVLNDRITADVIEAATPRLKIVSTISVGFNHIDVQACHKKGVLIGNTPDVLTETTADTTVAITLAACRRFKEAAASVPEGTWGPWTILGMCGQDVHSSTVGIVGLGRIGAAVARRLRAFNCSILYSGRSPKPDLADPLDATFVSLDELLEKSDIVIPLCPLNAQTTGMFDLEKFKKMKKSAVFVNAARGELVNQEDLVIALKDGEIFSAGLDVTTPEPIDPNHPLTKLPNCFIVPHIGSASEKTRTAMATLGVRNLVAAYGGLPLPSQVKP